MHLNDYIIVIADDDPAICRAFALFLESKGYQVHCCGSGTEALELCRRLRPSVALLDLDMPGLDGYETARQLRSDPDLAGLRVIAVTGRTDQQSSARAWEVGFHDFLSKPVPPSMLLAMVRPTREMQGIIDST